MALSDYALTTTTTLVARLGLVATDPTYSSQVAQVESICHSVSQAISRIAGRPLHRVSSRVEMVPHLGGPYLHLRMAPIVSVASVRIVDETGSILDSYASTDYGINAEHGELYRSDGWVESDVPIYRVTYTAGYITPRQAETSGTRDLPWDLEEACLRGVAATWFHSGQPMISSASRGDQSTSFREMTGLLPPECVDVALAYRRSL